MNGRVGALLLAGFLALGAASPAAAQAPNGPFDIPAYSWRDRLFGTGGLFFPDYVTPYERGVAYLIGRGPGPKGFVFGAATADWNCQQTQVPQITVRSAPPGVRLSIGMGSFVASGTDAGTTYCLGRTVRGTVVRLVGKAPRQPVTVTLRVTYPVVNAWYDHTVTIGGR